MAKTILFVDQELSFLKAVKRTFRHMRNEWNILLALSPDEALQIADTTPIDVLSTGMMFPGQSGLDFLNEIKGKYPQIVRIILSGHSDRDLILKSVDLAHQFLAKPCDDNDLKAAISRAFIVKRLLDSEPLRKVVTSIGSLPSLPSIYYELIEEIESDDASIEKIGDIIAKDLSLTTKMLKLVNSPFFGRLQHICDPVRAVAFLGIDLVQAIVLMSSTFDGHKGFKGFRIESLWEHAMTTVAFTRIISENVGMNHETVQTAMIGGLLHDIGKLLIAANLPSRFSEILQRMTTQKISMSEAELDILGTTHAAIGGYLLGVWGLPDLIIEAAAFHHAPAKENGDVFPPLVIIHMASCLANASAYLNDSSRIINGLDYDFLQNAQLLDHLNDWRKICVDFLEQSSCTFVR